MEHIRPLRLFDLSQAETRKNGFQLDEKEQQHLHQCEECQRVLVVFARPVSKNTLLYDKPQDTA